MNEVVTLNKDTQLYRSGIPRNRDYVWFALTQPNAQMYKNRYFEATRKFLPSIEYTTHKNYRLLDIGNPKTYNLLMKQSMPNENRRKIEKAIKLTGKEVTRESWPLINRRLAQLVYDLRNELKINGWIYKGPSLNPEVLLFGNLPSLNNRFKPTTKRNFRKNSNDYRRIVHTQVLLKPQPIRSTNLPPNPHTTATTSAIRPKSPATRPPKSATRFNPHLLSFTNNN